MIIKETESSELETILAVERAAFGADAEANLARDLLSDPSAQPVLSLLAWRENQAVEHILFTRVRIEPEAALSLSILAPLAVIPEAQNQGVGGQLIQYGLQVLTERGNDLVFVLGYPSYYSRYGFQTAGRLGFQTTYPIPEQNADAWMLNALRADVLGKFSGRVVCADALDKPEYWRE